MIVKADLHLHSCLTTCCDPTLSPRRAVLELVRQGVQLAALTDCNTALNCPAFALLCNQHGIAALYGMEAITAEGVRVLVLFADLKMAVDFCIAWYDCLPDAPNPLGMLNGQFYVDEQGGVIGSLKKSLMGRASVALLELERQAHAYGGLVIPAGVDAENGSLLSVFGRIPEGSWDALEFRNPGRAAGLLPGRHAVITSSNAMSLKEIGSDAFLLDIGELPLVCADGMTNILAVREGLSRAAALPYWRKVAC